MAFDCLPLLSFRAAAIKPYRSYHTLGVKSQRTWVGISASLTDHTIKPTSTIRKENNETYPNRARSIGSFYGFISQRNAYIVTPTNAIRLQG